MKFCSVLLVGIFSTWIQVQHPITPCDDSASDGSTPQDCPVIEE